MSDRQFLFNKFKILIIVVSLLGVFFRFYQIDRKLYWYDETMTSLRISGNTQTELVREVFNGSIISVRELQQKYQYPNSNKNLTDTINALAGNAEHSPLYYLMARFWLQLFGNSVTAIRSLSAIISLVAFPCIYWLCLELFKSSQVGWIAVILLAVSPFHVLYAQQAREYSLWTVAILLTSAAFLQAMRFKTKLNWGIYTATVAFSLYSHPFSIFVIIGQGIYVVVIESFRWSQKVGAYLLASLIGVLMFAPWLFVVATNFSKLVQNTASVSSPVKALPLRWLLNLSRLFFDFNQGLSPFSPTQYIFAILSVYALYFLYRKSPQAGLFILTLIGVLGLFLIVPDLILGGKRSSVTRYAIPCFLGIQLAVAYLVTAKIIPILLNDATNGFCRDAINRDAINRVSTIGIIGWDRKSQKRWRYIFVGLITSGVVSCAVSSQFDIWWHNSHTNSKYNPKVAEIVNKTQRPLVITDEIPGRVLSFSHLLNPEVHLQLVTPPNIPSIPDGFSNVFLYRPSEVLLQGIEREQKAKTEIAYKSWLWKVPKK